MKQYNIPVRTERDGLMLVEVAQEHTDDLVTVTLWEPPASPTGQKLFVRSDAMTLKEYRKLVREMRAAADFLESSYEKA